MAYKNTNMTCAERILTQDHNLKQKNYTRFNPINRCFYFLFADNCEKCEFSQLSANKKNCLLELLWHRLAAYSLGNRGDSKD